MEEASSSLRVLHEHRVLSGAGPQSQQNVRPPPQQSMAGPAVMAGGPRGPPQRPQGPRGPQASPSLQRMSNARPA